MDTNDPKFRKFVAMVIGFSFLFAGYVLTGFKGWSEVLFSTYAWTVVSLFVGFAVPNVLEKFAAIFPRKGMKS